MQGIDQETGKPIWGWSRQWCKPGTNKFQKGERYLGLIMGQDPVTGRPIVASFCEACEEIQAYSGSAAGGSSSSSSSSSSPQSVTQECCTLPDGTNLAISWEVRGCDCAGCTSGSNTLTVPGGNECASFFADNDAEIPDPPCAPEANGGYISGTCIAGGPLPAIKFFSGAALCCFFSLETECTFIGAGGYLTIYEGGTPGPPVDIPTKIAAYRFATARFVRASCPPLYAETDWIDPVFRFISSPAPSCVCSAPQMRIIVSEV